MKKKFNLKKIIEFMAIGGVLGSTAVAFALCPYSGIQLIGGISLIVLGIIQKKRGKNDEKKN